jgi:hypothetical protein
LHCRQQQLNLRLRVAVDKRWETHVNDTAPEVFIAEHPAILLYAVPSNATVNATESPAASPAPSSLLAVYDLILFVNRKPCASTACVLTVRIRGPSLANREVAAGRIAASDMRIVWLPEAASRSAAAGAAVVASSGSGAAQLDRVRLPFGRSVAPYPGVSTSQALSLKVCVALFLEL